VIARISDPGGDFEGAEKQLASDPLTHFGSMSIGEGVRDAYLDPDRQAAIAQRAADAGIDPALAQHYSDQMVGLRAAKDLDSVLTGGKIEASKAKALEDAGLLQHTVEPDGTAKLRVTDDAVPLLSPRSQQLVAAHGDKLTFTCTPGTPGDGINAHFQRGMARMAETADAMVQQASAPQPERNFRVRVVSQTDGTTGTQQVHTLDLTAPDAETAEQRGSAEVGGAGRTVVLARAQEMPGAQMGNGTNGERGSKDGYDSTPEPQLLAEPKIGADSRNYTSEGGAESANDEGENTSNEMATSVGAGNTSLSPFKPMSLRDMNVLKGAIKNKKAEMVTRYKKLGIVLRKNPDAFSVSHDKDGTITPNLSDDFLLKHAVIKSRGNLSAALQTVHDAHEEEYYHTIELSEMKRDWQKMAKDFVQRGSRADDLDFREYVKGRRNLLAQEVAGHIEGLRDPLARKQAVEDMADILRNYNRDKYGTKTNEQLWSDLQSDPGTRRVFVGEAVRQLAHYANENAISETGYLKSLNPNRHTGLAEFYKQMVFRTELNEFGPQLRDMVRRVAERVKAGG
jgi:hypothetical protein